jgi:hypothetical protein
LPAARRREWVDGFSYDPTDPDLVIDFLQSVCVHTKDGATAKAGDPIQLLDWHKDEVIRPLYGWKDKDSRRRYRVAYFEVPKKNAKSTLLSCLSIWHLVSSMLWLWCFGYILQDLAGNKHLIPVYLYGGVVGALVFLVAVQWLPASQSIASVSPLLGAGTSVMAVATATTALSPNYRLFPLINGGIPLWIITALYALIHFATLSSSQMGLGAGSLAAGAIGYMYIHLLQRGTDAGAWMTDLYHRINGWFQPGMQSSSSKRSADRQPYVKIPKSTQQRLD